MKKYRVESPDQKYCKTVMAKNEHEALAMVLGFYGGDQGYTTATEIT